MTRAASPLTPTIPARIAVVLATWLALTLVASAASAQAMYTPLEWQPKLGNKWTHESRTLMRVN